MSSFNKTGLSENIIHEICDLAEKHNVEKLVLFGSRARGDYMKKSDIDLAVSGGDVPGFSLDVDELTSTLLMYDVVDLGNEIQKELRDSIEKEGIVLYEKIR